MIVFGVLCVLSVGLALAWRLRALSRQATVRRAHAAVPGIPPTHLALRGRAREGAPRA